MAAGVSTAAGAAGACVASGADVPQATSTDRNIAKEMDNSTLGRKSVWLSIIVPIVTSLFLVCLFRRAPYLTGDNLNRTLEPFNCTTAVNHSGQRELIDSG